MKSKKVVALVMTIVMVSLLGGCKSTEQKQEVETGVSASKDTTENTDKQSEDAKKEVSSQEVKQDTSQKEAVVPSDKELIESIKGTYAVTADIISDAYKNTYNQNGTTYGKLTKYNSKEKIKEAFDKYCTSDYFVLFMMGMKIEERGGVLSMPLGDGTDPDFTNSKVVDKTPHPTIKDFLYVTITQEFMGDAEKHTYIFAAEGGTFKFNSVNESNSQAADNVKIPNPVNSAQSTPTPAPTTPAPAPITKKPAESSSKMTSAKALEILKKAYPGYTYVSGGELTEYPFTPGEGQPAYSFVFKKGSSNYVGHVLMNGQHSMRFITE